MYDFGKEYVNFLGVVGTILTKGSTGVNITPKNDNILFKDNSLELVPVELDETYRKKWNVHSGSGFYNLVKDGVVLNDGAIYTKGGFYKSHEKGDYQMLLKQTEAFYDDNITKVKKDKAHLEGVWVILNKEGVEKVVFKHFKSPYITKGSCIYHLDSRYYNIETGEFYGYSSSSMESKEFLFIDIKYDWEDKTGKKGIKKINKKTGEVEIFEQ